MVLGLNDLPLTTDNRQQTIEKIFYLFLIEWIISFLIIWHLANLAPFLFCFVFDVGVWRCAVQINIFISLQIKQRETKHETLFGTMEINWHSNMITYSIVIYWCLSLAASSNISRKKKCVYFLSVPDMNAMYSFLSY